LRKDEHKLYVIPIFLPNAGCKQRCVFCSQRDITGVEKAPTLDEVENEIESFLSYLRNKSRPVEIAFYGGTFTALPIETQEKYLDVALKFVDGKKAIGIRISTRPDDVPPEELEFLKNKKVTTIELGIQSFFNEVLKRSKRGYDSAQAVTGCRLVKEKGFRLGIHLMIGLPGSSYEIDVWSAFKTVEMKPDMVRIHPTLVVKNSELERLYLKGEYVPLTLEDTLDMLSDTYLIFSANFIPVNRIGLQIPVELRNSIVAGPYHPSIGDLTKYEAFYKISKWFFENFKGGKILLGKKDLSLLTGYGKKNLVRLKEFSSFIEINEEVKDIFFEFENEFADYSTILKKYIEEIRSKLKIGGTSIDEIEKDRN